MDSLVLLEHKFAHIPWLIWQFTDTSVLAYLLWIAYCVPTTLIMKNGGGVHQWNVQLKAFIVVLHVSIPFPVDSFYRLISDFLDNEASQYRSNNLRDHSLCDQAFNPTSVLEDLCALSAKEPHHVLGCQHYHRVELHFLYGYHFHRNISLQSTRKSLECIYQDWALSRR